MVCFDAFCCSTCSRLAHARDCSGTGALEIRKMNAKDSLASLTEELLLLRPSPWKQEVPAKS